jgi:error-prone DNA polymerase
MLSALHYAIDLLAEHKGIEVDLAKWTCRTAVYEMLSRADSVGVFQVESRADGDLPRLRPRVFTTWRSRSR